MKCPHCEYEHDRYAGVFNDATGEYENKLLGEHGDFYKLPVVLERDYDTGRHEPFVRQTAKLYACPSCTKTFVKGRV
jgi:hypothetical protein